MHGSDDDEVATMRREPPATVPDVAEAPTMAGPPSLGSLAPIGSGPVTPLKLEAERTRYALGELLGKGGMGEVRLAHDTRVDREVAVKLMRTSARTPEATARFLREARVQGRLDHPAVVPVHDLGVDEAGAPYFAMKRLTGTTLLDVLEAIGEDPDARERWPRRLLLDRLVDVCLAVEFAHARGVVHRDLKPANIMLGDYGEAYVLDWGIARIADEKAGIRVQDLASLDTPPPDAAGHTAAGALLGTPGYMAPEQMRGDPVDRRADVYALGCILFEILTLHPALPHGQAAYAATLDADAHHPRLRYPDADVAPELDDACARATAPDRAFRTGSARDLASAIRAYLDGDRDLARRRELALAHADAGARAMAAGDDGRADAMREAGRAISLDPTCRPAQDLLSQLLLQPPATPLPEVKHSVERERVRAGRVQLRAAGRVYVAYLLFLPLLLALGVRDWWPMVAIAVPVLMNFTLLEWAWRRNRSVGNLALAALAIHGLLLATIGVLVGPFLITPALAISSVATFCSVPTFYRPAVIVLVHATACALPFFLETVGVLPPTFFFVDSGLVLDPWAIDITPQAMVVLLVCSCSRRPRHRRSSRRGSAARRRTRRRSSTSTTGTCASCSRGRTHARHRVQPAASRSSRKRNTAHPEQAFAEGERASKGEGERPVEGRGWVYSAGGPRGAPLAVLGRRPRWDRPRAPPRLRARAGDGPRRLGGHTLAGRDLPRRGHGGVPRPQGSDAAGAGGGVLVPDLRAHRRASSRRWPANVGRPVTGSGDAISPAQRDALAKLAPALTGDVYVGGGVGFAAYLGHRRSNDIDLFSSADPTRLRSRLERIAGVVITSEAAGTLYVTVDGLPVSLIEYDYPLLAPPEVVAGLPVAVASRDDLACMKLSAIAKRGLARDFWDLHALIASTGRTLADYLAAFRRKHPRVDAAHVVRSLGYFGDAEAAPLPEGLSASRWAQIRRDFEAWVKAIVQTG